jgi:hypothetical protein
VNQELAKDVDKRIRVSNRLLDAQQQNLDPGLCRPISGDDDGEAF